MKLNASQQTLVADNLKLVNYVVNRLIKNSLQVQRLGYDDAFQAGCMGLINAAMRFKPELGFQFSTYAHTCIWDRVKKASRHQLLIDVPDDVMQSIQGCANKEPSEERITDGRRASSWMKGVEKCYEVPDRNAKYWEPGHDWQRLLSHLTPRERFVVDGSFRENRTLISMGQELGITRERVRQIYEKALMRLRLHMAGNEFMRPKIEEKLMEIDKAKTRLEQLKRYRKRLTDSLRKARRQTAETQELLRKLKKEVEL